MDSSLTEFVNEWLSIAEDDLRWAKASFEDGFYSRVCFVCQQVAEKALKAYLYGNKLQQKTHSLLRLMEACAQKEPRFRELKNDLVVLDPYYIGARYPDIGDIERFEKKELAQEALTAAEKISRFVKNEIIS